MTSTHKDSISSPSTPSSSVGSSGHKNSLKGTKLAKRARSFKDDLFEKISQMRTPTNTLGRSHSPHRRSKDNKANSEEMKPSQSLERYVRDIKNALKHFKDVISKRKLEVLPGNGTVILELVAMMYAALQSYIKNENSQTLNSATTQVYVSLGKLLKLCDEILLCENENDCAALNHENVKEIIDLVENAVQNLVNLANEKIKEKESCNTLSRPSVDIASQRTSLPDIALTPHEKDILEKSSSNPMRASHSTESILKDTSPPPKPPLPIRCGNPPPLPPKRRSQRNNNHGLNDLDQDSSLLGYGVDHLSIRSKSPDDNTSLSAGSLDSAFNHSREEEDELKAIVMETSVDDQFIEDEIDCAFSQKIPGNKIAEKLDSTDVNCSKDNRKSNESGFMSIQSMRASTQSNSTKRSSEQSIQSHKSSSIASSTELNSIKMESHEHQKEHLQKNIIINNSNLNQINSVSTTIQQQQHHHVSVTKQQNILTSNTIISEQHFNTKQQKTNHIFNVVTSTNNEINQSIASSICNETLNTNLSEDDLSFLNSSSPISPPPALPIKTRNKFQNKEWTLSQYDNMNEIDLSFSERPDLRSHSTMNFQSKHQSLMDPKILNEQQPPPLPVKKKQKHIIAYMEICSATSSRTSEPMRHSVHTYNLSSQSEQFSPNRSISHSQTMNLHYAKKQLVTQNSLNLSSPINEEKPPALPPKRQPKINNRTPTIITTPPPSPKPSYTLDSNCTNNNNLDMIRNNRIISGNHEMSTLSEDASENNSDDIKQQQQKLNNKHFNEENNDVLLRNNSFSKEETSPSHSMKNENYINLMEEIDVSDFIVFKKDSEDGPDIKGGQLDALIVHASRVQKNHENGEEDDGKPHTLSSFSEAFITTFRTFITPFDLVEKLIHRYTVYHCQVSSDQKQKGAKETFSLLYRVINDLTASDITTQITSMLTEFVYQLICSGQLQMAKLLREKIVQKVITYKQLKYGSNQPYERNIVTNQPTLLDLKSIEIAEQMTLLDADLFQKIEIPEVLLFAKDQCEEKSPNLNKFTEHFNNLSYWARSQILKQNDAKDREKHVIKFIKIMKNLRKMNNYNSYLALLSALDSAPIRRLEWHKTITEGLKEYCALIDSSSSFRIYRQALAETNPPCIPYIGLVLQDLTFVHVGNPDYLKDGIINFSKRWQQHNIIVNMKRFKKCSYPYKRNERIIQFFENFEDYLGEEQMWQISENIKPRGRRNPPQTQ